MVYVQRDPSGKLLRVADKEFTGATAQELRTTADVAIWLRAQDELQQRLSQLRASDLATVRILEDLVTLLVEKEVINYGDLPASARARLDERALVRADLEALRDEYHLPIEALESA